MKNIIENKKKVNKPSKALSPRKEYPKHKALCYSAILRWDINHMVVNVTINVRLFVANFSGKSKRMISVFQMFNPFFLQKIFFFFSLDIKWI